MSVRIEFEQVVQQFRVIRERPDTLREVFARMFRRNSSYHYYRALKGVSFHIGDGEAVGIVGRNGSGKSTMLKIIAGVFKPTSGRVRVHGTVAALIELAAGFHPELTGRENIVLNGLLLGLSRSEIAAKEQSIIDFAEIGDFIDSPVKQYSSGMYVRLGFAIATQLDPDILLMDEVLAVGDGPFQEKCLQRLEELKSRDKTIVLVSHDMGAIRQHCSRAILIDSGLVLADGKVDGVLARYEELQQHPATAPLATLG